MSLLPTTVTRIDRLCNRVKDHLTPGQLAAFREIVEHELRCQDRDTRHACAEAVCTTTAAFYEDGDQPMPREVSLAIDRAHGACMNAHAV